jgi:8-oxo-dGTP pyrophosphatase MutT (NUDIX family)
MQPSWLGAKMSAFTHVCVDDIQIFKFHSGFPKGAMKNLRGKFSDVRQAVAVERAITEVQDGSLYLADVTKGEIQILHLAQIISNRYWILAVYKVLMPSKHGGAPIEANFQCDIWNSGPDSGAGVLAITPEGGVIAVSQFRHSVRRWCTELPRGIRLEGESMHDCALREGREECGIVLTGASEVISLGNHDPETGAMRQEPELFAITHAKVDASVMDQDITEAVMGPVHLMPEELKRLLLANVIRCGWLQSAYLKAQCLGLVSPL